jgi:hypothetical protein
VRPSSQIDTTSGAGDNQAIEAPRASRLPEDRAMSQQTETPHQPQASPKPLTFLQRNRGWGLSSLYLGVATLLGLMGMGGGLTLPLDILILMGEPAASIGAPTLGAWPAVIVGVLLNGFAIGFAVWALDRFSTRMDGMIDLAGKVLDRPNH